MSKIEAELQAELERLELNMNASSQEGRSSDLEEVIISSSFLKSKVDQELRGDVVHGQLIVDKLFDQTDIASGGDKDRDSKGSSAGGVHDTNYSVCPKELSLRLHEVIQHKLEERIKELEELLSQSLKQLQLMEPEKVLSDRTFSNSEGNLPTHFANIRDEYGNELNHAVRNLIWGLEEGRKDSAIMPPWEVLKSRELNDTHESDGDEAEEYEDDESLVHPITCVPHLIALKTDPLEVNSKLAHHLLMNMNGEYGHLIYVI
uniref:Sister chromatid cohesion C-terminal domain-containing protein n=1 Tax=Ananas comosus var. bracteatus TaxID=296719 RepID=A0A6V7NLU0_ANACO|nr:unnamed protein product [Ananas comosus var. bracteatus]